MQLMPPSLPSVGEPGAVEHPGLRWQPVPAAGLRLARRGQLAAVVVLLPAQQHERILAFPGLVQHPVLRHLLRRQATQAGSQVGTGGIHGPQFADLGYFPA